MTSAMIRSPLPALGTWMWQRWGWDPSYVTSTGLRRGARGGFSVVAGLEPDGVPSMQGVAEQPASRTRRPATPSQV